MELLVVYCLSSLEMDWVIRIQNKDEIILISHKANNL